MLLSAPRQHFTSGLLYKPLLAEKAAHFPNLLHSLRQLVFFCRLAVFTLDGRDSLLMQGNKRLSRQQGCQTVSALSIVSSGDDCLKTRIFRSCVLSCSRSRGWTGSLLIIWNADDWETVCHKKIFKYKLCFRSPMEKNPKENNANIRHIRMNSKPDETYSFVLKAKLYHHQFYLKHIITCWLLWALWFFFSQSHKQFSATSKNPLEIQMLSAAENRSRCTSLGINLFIFTSGWVQNERGECRSGWKEHHGFWCFPALIHWL